LTGRRLPAPPPRQGAGRKLPFSAIAPVCYVVRRRAAALPVRGGSEPPTWRAGRQHPAPASSRSAPGAVPRVPAAGTAAHLPSRPAVPAARRARISRPASRPATGGAATAGKGAGPDATAPAGRRPPMPDDGGPGTVIVGPGQ